MTNATELNDTQMDDVVGGYISKPPLLAETENMIHTTGNGGIDDGLGYFANTGAWAYDTAAGAWNSFFGGNKTK